MRTYPQCIPCLINQGLNAVRKLNLGRELEKEIALRSLKLLSQFESLDRSPAYYAYFVQQIVKEISGTQDPFYEMKRFANEKAREILGSLTEPQSLEEALKLSCVGNYIDFAIRDVKDIEREVGELLRKEFYVWDYCAFSERLESSRSVLILGDNAGEIVFDKPLVKTLKKLGKEVIYAVKGKPILNDATYGDALEVSMTELCKVVSNGSDKVGTWIEDCSEEFRDIFYGSDIVISKGQANFETLNDSDRDIFFLLIAKCEPIASETEGRVRELIFKYKRG